VVRRAGLFSQAGSNARALAGGGAAGFAGAMTADRNLITDIPGVLVGSAQDERLASGVTVAVLDGAAAVACAVHGGSPGSRETSLLEPEMTASGADAIVLSGGSAFGLDAASGVQAFMREHGRGLLFAGLRIPIVAQAISFDLLNGGDKDWGRYPPYRELGYAAAAAAGPAFALGTAGGGYGATTANLKGGLGSASAETASGFRVGALVVVNAIASAVMGSGPHFWAAPYEEGAEFGGLGLPPALTPEMRRLAWKGQPRAPADGVPGTTIALVATDARLTKGQTKRLAIAAAGGLHKALRFANAATDGDAVFAAAMGRASRPVEVQDMNELGAVAGDCLARAIARGVFEATALPFPGALPAWRDLFGRA
jgi:L-aminopeptidase/D-esterase-like protein